MQYPSGKKYTLGYTPRGELRTLYDAATPTEFEAYYIYDPSSNLLTRNINYYQTHSTSTIDSQVNQLTQMQHILVGSSPKFNYRFDDVGRRQYRQRDGGLGDGFGYDLSGQITLLETDGTVNTLTGEVDNPASTSTLGYDANGNRIESAAPFNNLNQPTDSGTTYNANGDLASWGGWSYTYDAMNRLTAVSGPGGVTGNFWYDGFNRICTWQVNGSGNARFNVWDGWNLVAEYKSGSILDVEYLHGAGQDEMVSMTRAGQTYYFFQDGTGNTSHIASSSGAQLESYRYGLNGKPTVYDPAGNIRASGTAYGVRHLFAGLDWHQELSLIDYRNRFESIGTRKFMQPDPIGFAGDSANLYRYCANNSVNWSDPSGLWTFEIGLSFTVQLGPLTGNFNSGFAFDGYGNVGLYKTVLVGGGAGGRFSGGVSVAGSNGDTIFDLKDQFLNASAGGYAGGGASADGFNGRGSHNQIVVGGGATFGVGLGGGGSVGTSNTWITPIFQPNSVPDQITSTSTDGGHESDGTPIIKINVDASMSPGAPTEGGGKAPRSSPKAPNFGAAGLPAPTGGVLGPGGLAGLGPDAVFGSVTPPGNVLFLGNPFSSPVDGQLARVSHP